MVPESDLNEELMRRVGGRLGDQPFVDRVQTFPPEKPDRVVVTFADSYYPEPVSDAWLDLRIHLNDHNAREHFHPPPDVTTQTAIDIDLPADPYRAVGIAVRFIEDRIRDLWGRTELTYPSDYEFAHEYDPDIGR